MARWRGDKIPLLRKEELNVSEEEYQTILKYMIPREKEKWKMQPFTHLMNTSRYYFTFAEPIKVKPPVLNFDEPLFVKMVKRKWDVAYQKRSNCMSVLLSHEVKRMWQLKRQDVFVYPQFYNRVDHMYLLPDEISTKVAFRKEKILMYDEHQPTMKKLQHTNKFGVKNNKTKLYLPISLLKRKKIEPVVSQDVIAMGLVQKEKDANVVISRSGLKTLMSFHLLESSEWMLPFCIKEVVCRDKTTKLVLFVDKALPKTSMSVQEQKNWHGKKATNAFMIEDKVPSTELTEEDKIYIKEMEILEELESLQPEAEEEEMNNGDEFEMELEAESNSEVQKIGPNVIKKFYSYEMWNLQSSEDKNVLLKNAKKDLKIIVRNKNPCNVKNRGKKKPCNQIGSGAYIISSKLEYQPEYGGEQLTRTELIKEWVSLLLNSSGFLIRVRSNAKTLEYIHHDVHDLANVEKNLHHLYKIQIRDKLSVLYKMLNYLVGLPKGQYMLSHTEKDEAFAHVFKSVQKRKDSFDLYEKYTNLQVKEAMKHWPQIDLSLLSPRFRLTEKNKKRRGRPRKNKSVTENQ